MSSNNVIQFPGSQEDKKKSVSASPPEKRPTSDLLHRALTNKSLLSAVILGLCVFTFNFKFSGPLSTDMASKDGGRSLASVAPLQTGAELNFEQELARKLASITPLTHLSEGFGRSPSSDDQVRHGVLSSRGYIFKRDASRGFLISIRLQSDEQRPAYLLHPEEFIENYGPWFNEDFSGVVPLGEPEQIIGEHRVSHYLLSTHSGKKYEIKVERDLFQRLTSLSQTEVAKNSFN